jgi:hypothetical protein
MSTSPSTKQLPLKAEKERRENATLVALTGYMSMGAMLGLNRFLVSLQPSFLPFSAGSYAAVVAVYSVLACEFVLDYATIGLILSRFGEGAPQVYICALFC